MSLRVPEVDFGRGERMHVSQSLDLGVGGRHGLVVMRPYGVRPDHQFGWPFEPGDLLGDHIQQMNGGNSFPEVLLEAGCQYLADLLVRAAVDLAVHEVAAHLEVGEVLVRRIPRQHFEQDDPDAPDVALRRVDVLAVDFGTHVGRRAHVVELRRFLGLVHEVAEAEVCDSGAGGSEENIGGLHIAVDDLLLLDGDVALDDVLGDVEGLEFREFAVALDVLLEVAVLAELGHDVDVVLGHEYLDGADDVGVGEGAEGVDLVVEEVLLDCVFDLGELDDLDGDDFVGGLVVAAVDQRAEALPDRRSVVVDVVLYLLQHLLLLLLHHSLHHVIHFQHYRPHPTLTSLPIPVAIN